MIENLDKSKHPSGLSEEDRVLFHNLTESLFELYCSITSWKTRRRIIASLSEEDRTACLMMFKGDEQDILAIARSSE